MIHLPGSEFGRPTPTTPKKLNEHIYELYRPTGDPSMEILFFHGLQDKDSTGAYLSTWTCRDDSGQIWPSTWLVEEFPKAHVFSISYDSCMRRTQEQGRFDLHTVTENLTHAICWAKIGQGRDCPVILVGHSFGGLVIKSLCGNLAIICKARSKMAVSMLQQFLNNVRGVLFYGTPHCGSSYFDKVASSFLGHRGPMLDHVKVLSKELARLEVNFAAALDEQHSTWHIVSVGEAQPTSLGLFDQLVVSEGSARYGHGTEFCTANANHINLCKPASKTDTSFNCLSQLLQDIEIKVFLDDLSYRVLADPDMSPANLSPPERKAFRKKMDEKTQGDVMKDLVKWLGGAEKNKQEMALNVLRRFSLTKTQGMFIVSKSHDVLEGIVKLLHGAPSQCAPSTSSSKEVIRIRNLQVHAACILANLACGAGEIRVTIVNHPNALEMLVNSLFKKDNPNLQKHAARALTNLAIGHGTDQIKIKIINHPSALNGLVTCLSNGATRGLKEHAARALTNLTMGHQNNTDIKTKIFQQKGLLLEVVNSLSQENNHGLQEYAARALGNLAYGVNEIKIQIIKCPDALSKLVDLLSKAANHKIQAYAALALVNLSYGVHDNHVKIVNHQRALSELVNSLSKDVNPSLQEHAAYVLGNLAAGKDEVKDKIIKHPNALLELWNAMFKEANPGLQEKAKYALSNLAHKIGVRIVSRRGYSVSTCLQF